MKKTLKKLWKDESAQGATEYILLLVVLVGVVLIFKDKFSSLMDSQMGKLEGKINQFE